MKIKKIAAVGDLHFRGDKLADISRAWIQVLESAVRLGADTILQPGDVFDYYNIAGRYDSFGTVFDAFAGPLKKWLGEKKGRGAVFIKGNHDNAGPGQKDALVPLDGFPGITIAHIPEVFQFDGLAVACLPWLSKAHLLAREEYWNLKTPELEEVYRKKVSDVLSYLKSELARASGYKILLGHCELPGVKMATGQYLVGGSFELDKGLLERVGANRIILGHIHKRQGWYLGALAQLSFGDEGNPAGFEVLDTETGKSEWVDADSPRYFTVAVEDYEPGNYRPQDYVKLRGKELPVGDGLFPVQLPENVQFEKEIEAQVMTRRLSENLDPSASPNELLKVWVREAGCSIPYEELAPGLEPLLDGMVTAPAAIGSLSRINWLSLHNIASHKDTKIELPDGLTAITGHNGAGKTFLMESPLTNLYGILPSYPGTIFDYVPMGDSFLEMEFVSSGLTYLARREIHTTAKTRKQDGYLILDGKTIAGGPAKMDDFERACRELVGDPELVMASIFSSQNQAGDIADAKPAERKELFHKFLGIERFADIARSAKDRSQLEIGRIQEIELLVQKFTEEIKGKSERQAQLENIIKQISEKQVLLLNAEHERDKILAQKEKCAQVEKERVKLAEEKTKAQRDLSQVEKEIAILEQEKKEAEALIAREPEIQKQLQEVKELRTMLENVQEQMLAKKEQTSRTRELESTIALQEEKLKSEHRALVDKAESLSKQISILDTGEFGYEPCQKCRLLSGAHEAIGEKKIAEDRLAEIETVLVKEKLCQEQREELEKIKAEPVTVSDDPVGLQVKIKILQDAERQSGKLEAAKTHTASIDKMLDGLKEKKETLAVNWEQIKDKEIPASNLLEIETKEREIDGKIRTSRQEVSALDVDKGKAENEISRLDKLAAEIEIKKAQVETSRKAIEINDTLSKAFGKDGIPQLLIDAAIPQIQDILGNLLFGLDNAFSITISTQKVLRSNKIEESLDIIVTDRAGSRDINAHSGGEKKMLRTILRIALAIFQAQRSGKKLEVFFVDEAFDALDAKNAVRLLEILLKLQDRFNQVFIITHADSIIMDVPHIIQLGIKNDSTEVVQWN